METATAQSSNDLPVNNDVQRRDSFVFCSRAYPIINDSTNKGCSYLSTPEQLGCLNGSALFWQYFNSSDIARMNVEDHIKHMRNQMKAFSAEQVKCSLRGVVTDGYRVFYETYEGVRTHEIITSGFIDGHYVLVQLWSQKAIKRSPDIEPVFLQVIRLAD